MFDKLKRKKTPLEELLDSRIEEISNLGVGTDTETAAVKNYETLAKAQSHLDDRRGKITVAVLGVVGTLGGIVTIVGLEMAGHLFNSKASAFVPKQKI